MPDQHTISINIDQAGSTLLREEDYSILGGVEQALADGLALKRWFEATDRTGDFAERFEVVREFNQADESFGFYDRAEVGNCTMPIMGTVDDSIFDRPKRTTGQLMRDEMREFVLRYFMRVSDYRQPEAMTDPGRDSNSPYRSGLSWCPQRAPGDIGFGFSQHYYKLRGSGAVGKFHQRDEFAIIDLREIGEKYEWIVLKVRIFNFNMTLRLPGSEQARLVIPLQEESYLVVSRDFVLNEDDPQPAVLGRYGFGYAFVRNLSEGLLAYGPGEFDAAIELIHFHVLKSGDVRARLIFVVNRPDRIVNLTIDPVNWGFRVADLMSFGLTSLFFRPVRRALERQPLRLGSFDPVSFYISLANQLTDGLAADELCISREQLEKNFLVQHFMQHYQMLVGALLTWRRIPDWLDRAGLPRWVITGRNT